MTGVIKVKAHIVLAHPEPKSFNGQLSGISQQVLDSAGCETTLSDLYAMDFDPREGPQHYSVRKDAEVFHAQTEQRFNADNHSTPADVNAEAQRLLDCDLLVVRNTRYPQKCVAASCAMTPEFARIRG
jgi:NAD(P)H dehydrogenase (quinone)